MKGIYYEKQYNWVLILVAIGMVIATLTPALIQGLFSDKDTIIGFSVMYLILAISLILFYRMEIIADEECVSLIMGVGLIKMRFYYDEIESVRFVKLGLGSLSNYGLNPFYRRTLTYNAWVHNLGFNNKGVELRQIGKKKLHIIATRRYEEFIEFVNNEVKNYR